MLNVSVSLIFPILNYIYLYLHVIINQINPTAYRPKKVLSEQVSEKHGAMLNGEQVNNPIEEDDYTDNVVEDDDTH